MKSQQFLPRTSLRLLFFLLVLSNYASTASSRSVGDYLLQSENIHYRKMSLDGSHARPTLVGGESPSVKRSVGEIFIRKTASGNLWNKKFGDFSSRQKCQQQQAEIIDAHSSLRGGDNSQQQQHYVPSSNPSTQQQPFAIKSLVKFRNTVFPIHGSREVKKFLLLGSIKFFIILALTLTRDTKDTLVVTQCGAESIAFLKIYGVLPAAAGFIALYSKMASAFGKKTLFFITCLPFFLFFYIFDAFVFPNAAAIQPSLATVRSYLGGTKHGSGGGTDVLAKVFANWTSALYYIVAEIYSSVSVGILFWQFANDVVPIHQAKRFYPLFAQMSGVAPILAGQYVVRYASRAANFEESFHRLTHAVTFAGTMICVFYYCSCKFLENEIKSTTALGVVPKVVEEALPKKRNSKMSMYDSFQFLASSQYLRLIGTLVLGYGLTINFTEIMWKSLVKKQYPDPLDYQRFMGNFSSAVGLSTCIVIFFGVQVIRILGWRVGAMATPAAMAVLAIPFFSCILLGLDSPRRLNIAVMVGTAQSLLSKTSKYALFDPTTQMAYIPLDDESKVKGKAAIDVLGSRLGKSGGSLVQQSLVFIFGDILSAAPVLAVLFYAVLFGWLSAANNLSGLFMAKTEMQKAEKHFDGY